MQGLGHIKQPSAVRYVSADPDGVVAAPRGAIAIDTTTGVWYRNDNGSTSWWPTQIPARLGYIVSADLLGSVQGTGLGQTLTGTGTAAWGGDVGVPGYIQHSVSAVSDAVSNRGNGAANVISLGSAKTWFEGRCTIITAEDGTNRTSVRIGFGDSDTADFTDGAYFESSLAGNASANWFRCTASNGSRTKSDTGIAPVAGTYQRLRIKVNAAGTSVDFEIDGVSAGSNTTNIPTASGRETSLAIQTVKTLGATARTVRFDYLDMAQILTTAR